MDPDKSYLPRERLQSLLDALMAKGYRCVGPQIADGIIRYDTLEQIEQLPWGITQTQAPGEYRLRNEQHSHCFAWANGPQALKPYLFAPREELWQSETTPGGGLTFQELTPDTQPLAVLGVRPCDIAGLYLHDQHFLQQDYRDPHYLQRRQNLFLIAVNCTHPADTCFCASTGDGPKASYGYDIALTELEDSYLLEVHSESGRNVAAQLDLETANEVHFTAADQALQQAAAQQTRSLPSRNLKSSLFANLDHPRWEQVAERCLSCGNCTSVCPSCFCSNTKEQPSLDGTRAVHGREWDSCFTQDHSYIHGVVIRSQTSQRYRQWLTHKLGSWHDQYGRSGCVGCGRCITWCPVGIDITEEAAAICDEAPS